MEDSARPLNSRGKRDAPIMAQRVLALGIKPELFISSPAVRAMETAKLMAEVLKFPDKWIKYDWNIYHADPATLMRVVNTIESRFNLVFIFGHNPGFTYFANSLGKISIDNIPTSGIVGFQFSKKWSEIKPGDGSLLLYDYPKKIKE